MNVAIAPPAVPDKKRDAVIVPQNMGLAESKRHDYVADIAEDHTRDDLLTPGYWAHVAMHLSPFDRIEARSETGEWFSELVVVSSGRNYAIVRELQYVNFAESAVQPVIPAASTRHSVAWKGPKKFCVVRDSDKAIISEGHHTRQDADVAMHQYEARISMG